MSSETKYSEGSQLIRDIVNFTEIPPEILNFWDRLTGSAQSPEGWNVISVLNTMSKRGLPKGIDLMVWYEIFRDIYIMIMRAKERETPNTPVKVPRFTTFDRSFEQLAFLPDFWFGKPTGGVDRSREPGEKPTAQTVDPTELLLSIERYMYDQDGGACWSALDWAMEKYCFRVVCEPNKTLAAPYPQLRHIAALLLTAHYIVNGKMGLYIGERGEVDLPYAGISSGGKRGSTLLKYYHFDRFTRFSFIRAHELQLDADSAGSRAGLEPQWQALAAMTEFILQDKSARATKTTCTRVGINSFIDALARLRSGSALGGNDELRARLDRAVELLDDPDFAGIPPEKLLSEIGVHLNVIPADYYLRRQHIDTPEDFWRIAQEVFRRILEDYDDLYFSTVVKFTAAEYARRTKALSRDDCAFLMRALECGHLDELRGRMNGVRLRSALMDLLVAEKLELECGQLEQMLNGSFTGEKLRLHIRADRRETALPREWLTADGTSKQAAATLGRWARELLSEFSRDPQTGKIVRDFTKPDITAQVQQASDRLWNIYFGRETEKICRDRWMLSLADSIEILKSEEEKFSSINLPSGAERTSLLENNRRELEELSGGVPFDAAAARKRIAAFPGYTLKDLKPGYLRSLVITDLIARLMVTTAGISTFDALWSDPDELKTFLTHLLCASGDPERPLPFHIGIYSNSLLRLGRNGKDQRDVIDRLVNHRYDHSGELYFFILMLLKYLRRTADPRRILDAAIANPAMAEYAGGDRLAGLEDFLGGK